MSAPATEAVPATAAPPGLLRAVARVPDVRVRSAWRMWQRNAAIYRRTGVTMQVRPKAQIERFFEGLDMVEPGLQVLTRWRPDPDEDPDRVTDTQVAVYGGVARKP